MLHVFCACHSEDCVILTRHVLVNYSAKSEKLWHYDNNGCHEIGSNCQHKVKRDMRYEKTHQNLRYDIKCIVLNQNFYIICLTETMKEKNGIKEKTTISRNSKT
jgi:hypothetical protein